MISIFLLLHAVLLGRVASHATKSPADFYAEGMTGTYAPLVGAAGSTSAETLATCPPRLYMKVVTDAHHKNISIVRGELTDPTDTCPAMSMRQFGSIELEESPSMSPSVVRSLSPFHMQKARSDARSYAAILPRGLLQCPGDDVTPFTSLRVTSVSDLALPVVKSTLADIGVGKPFTDLIFGGIPSLAVAKDLWFRKHGGAVHRNVHRALNILRQGNEMVLLREKIATKKNMHLDKTASSCSYFGGASSKVYVAKIIPVLLATLRPLWTNVEQAPPAVNTKAHFLTDSRCRVSLSGNRIESIELDSKSPGDIVRGAYGSALAVPVTIGDTKCATLQLSRLSAVEGQMPKSPVGKVSLELARRLVTFLVDHTPEHDYDSPAQNKFAQQFPAFERQLQTLRIKSKLLVGRIDKRNCPNASGDEPLDVLMLEKSTSFLYCSTFADADLSTSHPCYRQAGETRYGLHHDFAKLADTSGSTMFVAGKSGTQSCVYDSSKEAAAHFRAALASTFAGPVPEPSEAPEEPRFTPEMTPEPGMDGPFTVPSRGRACFPAAAMATLRDGSRVAMESLKIGDEVEIRPGEFSPVIFFSHAAGTGETQMVVFETSSSSIAMSGSHLVPVGNVLKPAFQLEEGDTIWVSKDGSLAPETISHVRVRTLRGLYNPHTREGTVLASFGDGKGQILASSYTTAVHPAAAHAALMPLRWIHHSFGVTSPRLSNILPGTFVDDPISRPELLGHCREHASALLLSAGHGLVQAALSAF